MPNLKKILFVNRRAGVGEGRPDEMLEAARMAAAFGAEVHLAFLDDGVFQLRRGAPRSDSLAGLADDDIDHVWVEREALAERGLAPEDLAIPVTLVDVPAMTAVMAGMDAVISA